LKGNRVNIAIGISGQQWYLGIVCGHAIILRSNRKKKSNMYTLREKQCKAFPSQENIKLENIMKYLR
jgi:hypothetical protein